jgi:hypothetical protein
MDLQRITIFRNVSKMRVTECYRLSTLETMCCEIGSLTTKSCLRMKNELPLTSTTSEPLVPAVPVRLASMTSNCNDVAKAYENHKWLNCLYLMCFCLLLTLFLLYEYEYKQII